MPGKGKPFKKGSSGNPSGRSKLDNELAEVRKMTKEHYRDLCTLLMGTRTEELQALLDKPETSMLTTIIIRCLMVAGEKGDSHSLDKIMERVIGKVKDEMDVTIKPRPTIIRRRNGESVTLGTTLDKDEGEQ